MKRILLFLVMAFTASLKIFAQTATAPVAGDGTAGNPYQIATLNNLYWVAANSANWDKHYIQTADIDASATFSWFSGSAWIPIGNDTTNFTGSYDGQNHTISNLWINRITEYHVGFFGYTSAANISNLNIEKYNFIGSIYCGGIAGYINGGTISNCSSSGSAIATNSFGAYCGSFAGCLFTGTITNCSSSGAATASVNMQDAYSGGFVGLAAGVITNCSSSASATSTINGEHAYSGGFVGLAAGVITNCSSSGTATATTTGVYSWYSTVYTGGFAGYMDYGLISNCCSSGAAVSISTNLYAYSGGFVGYLYDGLINFCYSNGRVNAAGRNSMNIGGFVGSINRGNITSSYYYTDVYPTSPGGTGLTATQLRNQNSFVGWDFTNTWEMSSPGLENNGLPMLQYMDEPVTFGEITLKGNDLSIASGDATPSVTDFTDFGEAVSNNETITRTFEIANTAAADLNLSGTSPYVTLSGANSALFSVTKIPSTVITQNGNTTFRVAYTPTSAGTHSATVSISNNDDDESTYTFAIQGTGVSTPSIQSNNISFSNISRTGMTVSWNRGNGDKTLLLGKQSYRIDDSPLINGTTYPANSASFTDPLNATADGAKVLYNGSSLNPSVNITNLTRYKLYYFKVAEFNEVRENDDNITLYNQSESSNNPRSRWTLRKEDGTEYEPSEFVYPNPATNEINCEVIINETSDIRLDIYSMDSRLVKKINFGRYREGVTKLTADINELSTGSYLLVYHLGEEQMMTIIDVVK